MIFDSVMIAPLLKLLLSCLPKTKCPAALLLDYGSDRYEASGCKANIMSLATNRTPVFGCVAQYSRNCFTSFSIFSVPLDCRDAMELMVAAMVGLTAMDYHV